MKVKCLVLTHLANCEQRITDLQTNSSIFETYTPCSLFVLFKHVQSSFTLFSQTCTPSFSLTSSNRSCFLSHDSQQVLSPHTCSSTGLVSSHMFSNISCTLSNISNRYLRVLFLLFHMVLPSFCCDTAFLLWLGVIRTNVDTFFLIRATVGTIPFCFSPLITRRPTERYL